MIQQIFLVAFCLLTLCQSSSTPMATSIIPTSVPLNAIRSISIFGNFPSGYPTLWPNYQDAYSCYFVELKTWVKATYIDSSHITCNTPILSNPRDVTIQTGIAEWYNPITKMYQTKWVSKLRSAKLQFNYDRCYQAVSFCKVHGDPHFAPFCGGIDWAMQPGDVTLNLVTSKDNRFIVYGKTTPLRNSVSYLYSISIIGPGSDGKSSSKITLDSTNFRTVEVYINGAIISTLPYTFNNIVIYRNEYHVIVKFPGGEIVDWDGYTTADIILPGAQYWRNVEGLCGTMDTTYPYCAGPDNVIYNENQGEDCAKSWIVEGLKRSIAQDSNIIDLERNDTIPDNSTYYYQNDTIEEGPLQYSNLTVNSTAFVITDNILSKAATKICVFMFEILDELCPANFSENLPNYQSSCIYDGSALLTNQFAKISPSTDIASLDDLLDNVKNFFSNLKILGETILDEDTFSFIRSSVQAGLQDCYFYNLTNNATEFDIDNFYSVLPTCSSYCKFPGATCSAGDECQLSLTLEELINLVDSGSSTIPMNVIAIIGSLMVLLLSIW